MALLINTGLLDANVPLSSNREFQAVEAERIVHPQPNPDFFETIPTIWAPAYSFRKSVESGDPQSIEEWATLFLLFYWRVIHIEEFAPSELARQYDPDFWTALQETYPLAKSKPNGMRLLLNARGTTVGGVYPEIFFFPARNREGWKTDPLLSIYLKADDHHLSWSAARDALLKTQSDRQEALRFLNGVANTLPDGFRKQLSRFIVSELGQEGTPSSARMASDPLQWPLAGGDEDINLLLSRYPLQKENQFGGITYFLVHDFPYLSDWMTAAIGPGLPSPVQFRQDGIHAISVTFGGVTKRFPLNEQDQIISLRSLFLDSSCRVSASANDKRVASIRALHRFSTGDNEKVTLCTLPVTAEFLSYFPYFLEENDKSIIDQKLHLDGIQEWTFSLPKPGSDKSARLVTWKAETIQSEGAVTETTFVLWPPKIHPDWGFYAAYMTGNRERCGRWCLVDCQGGVGHFLETERDEYVSFIDGESGKGNTWPRAIMWQRPESGNRDGEPGGVFFLNLQTASTPNRKADLAVDFGTSNTSLAFRISGEHPRTLSFSLSPAILWPLPGGGTIDDTLGVVPLKYGAKTGFFSTILCSRIGITFSPAKEGNIQVKELFNVGIPSLYSDVDIILSGSVSYWERHPNLKWDLENNKEIFLKYRPLFLAWVLIHAHAELFFAHQVRIDGQAGKYVFTFPLAFKEEEQKLFHNQNKGLVSKARLLCYRETWQAGENNYIGDIDESTAAARSRDLDPSPSTIDVFIDVGGGTADIAVAHDKEFLVLDSIKVAGKVFFDFSKRNFFPPAVKGNDQFKNFLGQLLFRNQRKFDQLDLPEKSLGVDFQTYYSMKVNELDDVGFTAIETTALEKGFPSDSYHRYRTALFFRHLLSYGLIQACASIVNRSISPQVLTDGIRLVLGGNAWGFLFFANFKRSSRVLKEQADSLLDLLKTIMRPTLTEEEWAILKSVKIFKVDLLNEQKLNLAKTCVPIGALTAADDAKVVTSRRPFSGITFPNVQVNDFPGGPLRWCERWGPKELLLKFLPEERAKRAELEFLRLTRINGGQGPIDPLLSLFTILGDESGNDRDQITNQEWQQINTRLCDSKSYADASGSPLGFFLSGILYPNPLVPNAFASSEEMPHRLLDLMAKTTGKMEEG